MPESVFAFMSHLFDFRGWRGALLVAQLCEGYAGLSGCSAQVEQGSFYILTFLVFIENSLHRVGGDRRKSSV